MAPKKANKGKFTVPDISAKDLLPNPFLEVPTWAKSREIMKDIGNAQKWATTIGALLKHSPQQCHAVANILTKGCDYSHSKTEADEAYCHLYRGFTPSVHWIYENAETVEQTKLYELLLQRSQELDVNLLPLKYAQCCSRCMLDDVSRDINVAHYKKSQAQLAAFLASGGTMPDTPGWNFSELLKGSPWDKQVQPKSK